MIDIRKLPLLAGIFRGPFLRRVATGDHYDELCERLSFCGLKHLLLYRLVDIFQEVYGILERHYRCEYVFKNALMVHFLEIQEGRSECYLTDEFRVGKSRVDLALFSKTSVAFEIKTDLDSTARLASQSCDYARVFDLVFVVTSPSFTERILREVPNSVGLIEFCADSGLTIVRDSRSHAEQTCVDVAFDCLRQAEMKEIAALLNHSIEGIPNSKIYSECKARFSTLQPKEAQSHLIEQLRRRRSIYHRCGWMAELPYCLKHAIASSRASRKEIDLIKLELDRIPLKKKIGNYEQVFSFASRQTERVACA